MTDADNSVLPSGLTEEQVRRDDREHVFHSWSAQAQIDPLPIADAQGSWFTDYTGKRYLDFSSQLVNVNIGYQHPKLVAAIQEYAGPAVRHRAFVRQRHAFRGGQTALGAGAG